MRLSRAFRAPCGRALSRASRAASVTGRSASKTLPVARTDSTPRIDTEAPCIDTEAAAAHARPAPAESEASFAWSGRFELEHEEMDGIHREFVVLVDALLRAPDVEPLARLDALIEHTRHHFQRETTWMQLTAFPPIHCHEAEHARVMEVATTVRERVAAGEPELARTLAAALAEWFEIHADTMDRALATWLAEAAGRRG